MITALKFIMVIVVSYLLGNIHFARIISKKICKDDITKRGSGNPGTMNMVRNYGIGLGLLTLLLDALKGAAAALFGYLMLGGELSGMVSTYALYLGGFSAVIGHVFPVFYNFKGGKGVATSVGFFTIINPLLSGVIFFIGIFVWIITKIGSLTSLFYITSFVITTTVLNYKVDYILPLVLLYTLTILIFVVHKNNIKKLFSGKETKVDFKTTLEKDKENIKLAKEAINKSKKQK